MTNNLTQENVRALFDYDEKSGHLIRKISAKKSIIGKSAFKLHKYGYYRLSVGTNWFIAHRVVWLWHHGCWPTLELDHINGDKLDNRIENLREATDAQNTHNRKAGTKNKTGFIGVYPCPRSRNFLSLIYAYGKSHYLGVYKTAQEAYVAYLVAKERLHDLPEPIFKGGTPAITGRISRKRRI